MSGLAPDSSGRERANTSARTFTLSSTKPDNPVILQRSFQGRGCIPFRLANLCTKNRALLLKRLNDILQTRYTFRRIPKLKALLDHCIESNYDLGMTYGLLRPYWYSKSDLSSLLSDLHSRERKDSKRRACAVDEKFVIDRWIPPRRVWDLYSNRVLQFWMLPPSIRDSWKGKNAMSDYLHVEEIMAVSHAWMSEWDRTAVTTSIRKTPRYQGDLTMTELALRLFDELANSKLC